MITADMINVAISIYIAPDVPNLLCIVVELLRSMEQNIRKRLLLH